MKIQVLGMGCPKCKQVAENAQEAIRALGVEAEVVKVQDIQEIMQFGVMVTPALAIDGEVKVAGKVPKASEITRWIQDAGREAGGPSSGSE